MNAPAGWGFSTHAKQRRREMHLTEDDVCAVLFSPLLDLPDGGPAGGEPDPRLRRAIGERIVVLYAPASKTIVTVLWRSDDRPLTRADGAPTPKENTRCPSR